MGVGISNVSPVSGAWKSVNNPPFNSNIFDCIQEKEDVISRLVVIGREEVVSGDCDVGGFVENDPYVMLPWFGDEILLGDFDDSIEPFEAPVLSELNCEVSLLGDNTGSCECILYGTSCCGRGECC